MPTKRMTLLLLLTDTHILLAMKKRGFGAGRWNGVGGKIEPGESVLDAIIRECQEEIGVTPKDLEKVAYFDFRFPDGTADMAVHTFVARDWDGDPIETEEMAPRWFQHSDIPYDNMWQDDLHWLPLVMQGKKIKGDFTFDQQDIMLDQLIKIEEVESFDET